MVQSVHIVDLFQYVIIIFLAQSNLLQSLLYFLGVVLVLNQPYIRRNPIFTNHKRR
jgi:hypothetical protein